MDRFNQCKSLSSRAGWRAWTPADTDHALPVNPFAKRVSHSSSTVITYKVLTLLTWVLSVVFSVYYTVDSPADDIKHGRTIEGQNWLHLSGFTLNFVLVYIYL